MADETLVEKQVRLVLEQQCRQIANLLKPQVPAGVGFILFLSDFGDGGNVAYVSTVEREGAIKLVQEWLDAQDDTYDVKRLRELLYTAGASLVEIASAVGFEGNAGDLGALLAHCRTLRESRDEVERLRSVIRTGGAAYRLERAAMGIPGGIDADGQPIATPEGSKP